MQTDAPKEKKVQSKLKGRANASQRKTKRGQAKSETTIFPGFSTIKMKFS